jgi:hypothetical protein
MDTIDSRRKFEKWFKDSLFAECNVPSKEALHDAWCAASAQDGGEPVAWQRTGRKQKKSYGNIATFRTSAKGSI